jgi:eukaryotic-like serine/threonine-protein kinase
MASLDHLDSAELLARLSRGDEAAARVVFARYTLRLAALVTARLVSRFQSRLDPEDVVASAWRSFFTGARNQRWTASEGDLWPLLSAMTLRKLFRQVRRHEQDARDVGRQQPLICNLAESAAQQPAPAHDDVVCAAESLEAALESLDPLEREVLILRLRGDDSHEIMSATGCSERTIGRAFAAACESIRRSLLPEGDSLDRGEIESFVAAASARVADERSIGTSGTFEDQTSIRRFHFSDLLLQKMIGQGGVGRVYRAVIRAAGHTVAVKFLKKRFWERPQAVQSLLAELTALNRIDHAGVVQLLGWGRTPTGTPFLVTELIEGQSLASHATLPHGQDVDLLATLADVATILAAVHAAGLVHGDVAPGNLILESSGSVRLTDFGMSRSASQAGEFSIGGTPGVLAPEQLSHVFGEIGPWTDVYGFGATAYALVTGEPLHTGTNRETLVASILSDAAAEKLSRLVPAIGDDASQLIESCLQPEIALRRQIAMSEMAVRLRGIRNA